MRPLTSVLPGGECVPREPRTLVTSVPGCSFSAVAQPTALTQIPPLDQCPSGKNTLFWPRTEPGKMRVCGRRVVRPLAGAQPPAPQPWWPWRAQPPPSQPFAPGLPGVSLRTDLGYAFLAKKKKARCLVPLVVWCVCSFDLLFPVALHWKGTVLFMSAPRRRQCPVPVRP